MTNADDQLPETLLSVRTRPLFVMRLNALPPQVIGGPASAFRRISVMPGGSISGERVSGAVLEGGTDWQMLRDGGRVELDVRLVIKTNDGAMIGMKYTGVRRGPAEVLKRIDTGQQVDPSEYYFRASASFETASAYDWLNGIVCVGVGSRLPGLVIYNWFEVL